MNGAFLKVRLARFQPSRPFARDVYLHLALNNRYVKLVSAGDDLSPSMLSKLVTKNTEFLHVPLVESEVLDPETFALYQEGPGAPSPSSPNTVAIVLPASREPSVAGKQPTSEISVLPGQQEPSSETRIAGSQSSAIDQEKTFKSENEVPAADVLIKADQEKEPDPEFVFSTPAALQDEGGAILERLKSALIGEKIVREVLTLHQQVSNEALKERKKHRREYVSLAEAFDRATTGKLNTLVERRFPVDQELDPFKSLGGPETTAEQLAVASDRILTALKTAETGRKTLSDLDRLITESERFRDSPVLKKLQAKLNAPVTEESKLELKEEVKKTFMMEKISEEILKFSSSPEEEEPEHRIKSEIASLERALETVSAGGNLPKEVERRFSADKEAEEFVTVFAAGGENGEKLDAQLQTIASKREQALEELDQRRKENGLLRAKSHRDLPATVSRLASYLGYSLGYSDHALLSDLALSAILHFAKKEEDVRLSEGEIPPFVAGILTEGPEQDFVKSDAKEIIQILNAYLDNPECDREQKDFVKRVFDQTIDSLTETAAEIDSVNLAKWEKFVERGPDLQGHSICVKASANAVKQSKSIII